MKELTPHFDTSITLISKSDKDKRKLSPIFLMNIKKILKIFANQIQTYTKRIIHHDQIGIYSKNTRLL